MINLLSDVYFYYILLLSVVKATSPTSFPTSSSLTTNVITLAGGKNGSMDGIGTYASFTYPEGLCLSSDDTYALISDTRNNLLRKITLSTAQVITIVGNTQNLSSSINGIGTNAVINTPIGTMISKDGTYALITEYYYHTIKKVDLLTYSVTTYAGFLKTLGTADGIGTNARLSKPYGFAISPDGSFAILSEVNNRIRRIELTTMAVTTVAGQVTSGSTNGIGTVAQFRGPRGIVISLDGSYVLFVDTDNHRIRKIVLTTRDVTTLLGNSVSGFTDAIGTNAQFKSPYGLALSPNGLHALVGDSFNHAVRQIVISTLLVSTLSGNGTAFLRDGPGSIARHKKPTNLQYSSDGTFALVLDSSSFSLRKIWLVPPPTFSPTTFPTFSPTVLPSALPSHTPTTLPSAAPTVTPSISPSFPPTFSPSTLPSCHPTALPSSLPSTFPTSLPTSLPSKMPTLLPSGLPSLKPSMSSSPPLFLSIKVTAVTASQVIVGGNLSSPGYLVCRAFFSTSAPATISSEMILMQSTPVPSIFRSNVNIASYTLTGLVPLTNYNIYCSTLSQLLIPMTTDLIISATMTVKTKCCRQIKIRLQKLVVDDVSVYPAALTLELENQPINGSLQISISGISTGSSSIRREMFVPAIFSFSDTSNIFRTDLNYVPVVFGTYKLNISLTGSARNDYVVVYTAGDVLTVKGTEAASPAPLAQGLEFSADGSKLFLTFQSPSNRCGVLNTLRCSLLFDVSIPLVSFLSSARCVWTSDSRLEISSIGSLLQVGDVVSLKQGVYKARCTSNVDPSCTNWPSNSRQNISIALPSTVTNPRVILSLPSEIGACDNLLVDLSSSSGSGGRSWKSVTVTVSGSSPNITLLQNFLSSISPSTMRSPFAIPNNLLVSSYSYSMQIRLCNFLNGCGFAVKIFVVSPLSSLPIVTLFSRNSISTYRNSSIILSANAYTTLCSGGTSGVSLLYTWMISENQLIQSTTMLQSTSVNPREFKLPSYRLTTGTLYVVTLSVKHQKSQLTSSSSVQVYVESGDLICVLKGGDSVSLSVDGSVLLDMSGSYDSNLNPWNSSLIFEISCFQLAPIYLGQCAPLSLMFVSHYHVLITANHSSNVSISTSDVYSVRLIGRTSSSSDSRRCEKVVRLTILESLAPVVRLEVRSGIKMNPSSKLKILAMVDMKSAGELSWSLNDPSISLSSISISPLTNTLPTSTPSTPNVLSLVLIGDSLPEKSNFLFSLTCSLAIGYTTTTSITISTNAPPFGGTFLVSPIEGIMLKTVFSFEALFWVDDDLPLSYEFGYLSGVGTGVVVLRSKLTVSHTSTQLPAGPRDSNETILNLTSVVNVIDSLDSSSRSVLGVKVSEVVLTIDDIELLLRGKINISKSTSDADYLKNSLSSTTTVLNRINCSNAPNCMNLNRMECFLVEGTCGECLMGYIGLSGPSNTLCIHKDASRRRLDKAFSVSSRCDSDGDCAGDGLFVECNMETHQCQSIQQTCPNFCTGHGRCEYVSKYLPNVTVEMCDLLTPDCRPICRCDEGYLGSTCSSRPEVFAKEVRVRNLIVTNIGDLMKMENPERSNVMSWIKSLSSVASDYLVIDEASKLSMTNTTIQILELARDLGLTIETLRDLGMDRVVDMCISGLSDQVESEDEMFTDRNYLLMSLVEIYSEFITSDMTEDQYPSTSLAPFFRSSSYFLTRPSRFRLPTSELEELGTSSQQYIDFSSSPLSYPFKFTLSETLSMNRWNGSHAQLSPPLHMTFQSAPCYHENNCLVTVVLRNKYLVNEEIQNRRFLDLSNQSLEVECEMGKKKNSSRTCPSGDILTIECNGSFAGTGQQFCPQRSSSAHCTTSMLKSSNSSGDVTCHLSDYNDTTTICICDLSKIRVIGDDSSVSFTILALQSSVITQFVSTWKSAPSLSVSDAKQSWTVIVTLGTIAVFFMVVILMSLQYDAFERNLKTNSLSVSKNLELQPVGIGSSSNVRDRKNGEEEEINLIEESLPDIFNSDSLWNKFKKEMRVYHRWLGIVCYYSPVFPRAMRALSLFTSIVIMLFIQSVTYNIADPDDNSCEACRDENCCLSLTSTLNAAEDRCYWEAEDAPSSTGSCHLRDIDRDMVRMFIVALISAIVSAPLALSIQYLISDVLSKESMTDEEEELFQAQRSSRRRVTTITPKDTRNSDLIECCGGSLHEDLDNLLRELSGHYKYLMKIDKNLAQEFRVVWGSLVEKENANTEVISIQSLPCFNGSNDLHAELIQEIMKELSQIRRQVRVECRLLKEGLETIASRDLTLRTKRKRLLYYFTRDLSTGLTGDVVASKVERDTMSMSWKANRVPLIWKRTGWIFVILLNGGMLFYVFLFAIQQTYSRQSAWFLSFIIWLIFEIFVSSTGLVLIFHIVIPLYVLTDVAKLKEKVFRDLLEFRDKYLQKTRSNFEYEPDQEFNAAKYLWTSWRIASLFPEIPESKWIREFHTPWPKKRFGGTEGDVSSDYDQAVILTALSRILMYFLASLLQFHTLIQDILIQMAWTCGVGYFIVWMIQLSRVHLALPLVPALIFILGLYLLLKYVGRGNGQVKHLLAVHPNSSAEQSSRSVAASGILPQSPRVSGNISQQTSHHPSVANLTSQSIGRLSREEGEVSPSPETSFRNGDGGNIDIESLQHSNNAVVEFSLPNWHESSSEDDKFDK